MDSTSVKKKKKEKKRTLEDAPSEEAEIEKIEDDNTTNETKRKTKSKKVKHITQEELPVEDIISTEPEETSVPESESNDTIAIQAPPMIRDEKGIFSDSSFADMPLSPKMQTALTSLNFIKMTQIQAKSIPDLLAGKDLIGAAKTGSGKTLSFLIPIIELLSKTEFTRKQGTGAVIISPTRELSLQVRVLLKIC